MMLLANNGTMILLQRHKPRHYLYLERFLVSCPKFLISVLQGCFSAISVLMQIQAQGIKPQNHRHAISNTVDESVL